MFKKLMTAALAAASVLCLSIPAAAETFVSSDGVLSIELPNENWKQMQDPVKWLVFSDGANLITIEHYSNGEKLPESEVADENFVSVYRAEYSTQNEVFISTGKLVDAARIKEVVGAISTIQILKYDTKLALKEQKETEISPSEFSIVPVDKTMYATAGVNVRRGCSTEETIIGGLELGAGVRVTGVVQRKGADYGWYRVDYNGVDGYVSASFLSDQAPSGVTASGRQFTGKAVTIYAQSGTAITIYESTDGQWYDGNGVHYIWLTENSLTNDGGGEAFTTNKPANTGDNGLTVAGDPIYVYWMNGSSEKLTPYSDGSYYTDNWVQYWYAGGGAYAGADGTTLYWDEPILTPDSSGSKGEYGLSSQGSGRPVVVHEEDGQWYDVSGVMYYNQGNGTFVDENGDVFNIEW